MELHVDETNLKSVQEALSSLHKIRKALTKDSPENRISNIRWEKRLDAVRREFDCIMGIHNADVSALFGAEQGEHYVYAHCSHTPLNAKENARHLFAAQLGLTHVPFYIGKGCGDRADDLSRNEGHRKIRQYLLRENKDVIVHKIKTGISENVAFGLEGKLIDIFGLKYLCKFGLLVNLDEGLFATERRTHYPKGSAWYLNRIKLQPHKS